MFWISTPWYSCVYFMLNLASTGQYRLSNQVIACKGRIEARVHLPHIPIRKNIYLLFWGHYNCYPWWIDKEWTYSALINIWVLIFHSIPLKASLIFVKSLSICLHYLWFNGHKEQITSYLLSWDVNTSTQVYVQRY